MTADESGRPSEDGGPPGDDAPRRPTGSESLNEVGGAVLWGLASAYVGRVMFLQSLVWLVVGGGLLAGAWSLVRGEMHRRETVGIFNGRAQGAIEAPWWELAPSREQLGGGTNWLAGTTASACARLRFRPEGGDETTTAYCRRFRWIHGESLFTWEEALGAVPVPWVDGAGMPRIELRIAPGLVRRIEALGPRSFLATDPGSFEGPDRARRADRLLGRVWREIDDPFLRLLEEWSKSAAVVTVAYPPDEPERAVPVELLGKETTGWSRVGDLAGWSLVIPLGLFGLLAWGTGSYLLTGGSRWGTAALVLAGIPGVLLVGGKAVDLASLMWADETLAVESLLAQMLDPPPELVLAVPPGAHDSEAEVLVWTLEASAYARLLHWIDLEPPGAPTDPDGVLRHLVGQVGNQAATLPDDELADLLAWAVSVQERGGGEELGLLFVDLALELQDHPGRSRHVRWGAEDLLHALALHEPSTNPYRLAVAERRRILERASATQPPTAD